MELTWIAIIASLLMGIGALLIFIFAVKQDYFRNLEETKYQVFWSDIEELVESTADQRVSTAHESSLEDQNHGDGEESRRSRT